MSDRACSCAESASLHDSDHCCLRGDDWFDAETGTLACGHGDDFRARAKAAALAEQEGDS